MVLSLVLTHGSTGIHALEILAISHRQFFYLRTNISITVAHT